MTRKTSLAFALLASALFLAGCCGFCGSHNRPYGEQQKSAEKGQGELEKQ